MWVRGRLAAYRFGALTALALLIFTTAWAALPPGHGFTLVTADEYRRLQQQASRAGGESTLPEPRALDVDAPKILVDEPKLGAELHAPLRLALRFEPAADAKIDLSSFQVIYKLGLIRMDITDRIRPFVALTETGVSGSSAAAIPAGDHTIIVRVRDTQKRVGEQTITFRMVAN